MRIALDLDIETRRGTLVVSDDRGSATMPLSHCGHWCVGLPEYEGSISSIDHTHLAVCLTREVERWARLQGRWPHG